MKRTLEQIEADLAQNKIDRTEARRIAGLGGRSGGNARRQHTELLRQASLLIAERDNLTKQKVTVS